MPITGITIVADSVVVSGVDFDALCAAATENEQLRKALSQRLQEKEELQRFLERFQELLALDPENHPGTDLGRLMLEVGESFPHPTGKSGLTP